MRLLKYLLAKLQSLSTFEAQNMEIQFKIAQSKHKTQSTKSIHDTLTSHPLPIHSFIISGFCPEIILYLRTPL